MKSLALLTITWLLAQPVYANFDDMDFDSIDAMLDQQFEDTDAVLERRYQAVDQAIKNAMAGLTTKIEVNWGADELQLPQAHQWVDYSADMKTRRIMNFEQGTLVVETLVAEDEPLAAVEARVIQHIESAATDNMAQLAQKDQVIQQAQKELAQKGIETESAPPVNTPDKPVLDAVVDTKKLRQVVFEFEQLEKIAEIEQVQHRAHKVPSADVVPTTLPVQTESAERELQTNPANQALVSETTQPVPTKPDIANKPHKEASQQASITTAEVTTPSGEKLKKVRVEIPFLRDFQQELIRRHFDTIQGFAKKYDLPVSLILAIMQTESSFNPRATSPIPAFGLMQLVPRTAGIDAYNHVYGEKKVLAPEYLYVPDQNIELGVAYFYILTNRYLRKVKDPLSRFYCAVAAYNTGVGNVAKTFVGSKSISKAASAINQKTPQQVFDFLKQNLPASETRRYLSKVTKAKKSFEQWDKV